MGTLVGDNFGITAINLLGETQATGNTKELSAEELQLKKLKKYLIDNFIEPLIMRKVENVNFNTYNFGYILTRLNRLKHLDPEEIAVYEKIVIFVQETLGTYNSHERMVSKLYKNAGVAQFINTLPFITLKPHYEVYNSLYGRPEKFKYDKKILKEIEAILKDNPGIVFKKIEGIINYRFKDSAMILKMKKNIEKDTASRKIEFIIYDNIFDKTQHNNKYNDTIVGIITEIIKNEPTLTTKGIKKYIYDNHRYWSQYFIESIHDNSKSAEECYDILFGAPIDKNYKNNYLTLIKHILKEYPGISMDDLELEFEFKQPIWAELLLKNQTINALLFKQNRFHPVYINDKKGTTVIKAPPMEF
jgi:hypothetical protein